MKGFLVTYFVAYKFPLVSETVYNKMVRVSFQKFNKMQQLNDVLKEIADKSILRDYYHDEQIEPWETFYRHHTTIISLTEL